MYWCFIDEDKDTSQVLPIPQIPSMVRIQKTCGNDTMVPCLNNVGRYGLLCILIEAEQIILLVQLLICGWISTIKEQL